MRGKLGFVVAGACLAMSFGWAVPAFAYPAGVGPALSTNTSTTTPGGSLLVTGSNFVPNEGITLTLHSTPVTLATTTASGNGTFSVTVTIPSDTTPGTHTILAAGASGDSSSTTIFVTGAISPPATVTSGLAFTGADIAAVSGVGAIALALGGMLVLTSRRRRVAE
jgi:hypothetical protein